MDKPYKYITVLDYLKGQVYVYDYDETKMPNAEDFVARRHNMDDVYYMVHKWPPALWCHDLFYTNREEAYRLNEEQE